MDTKENREVTLEQALDCLERLGLLNPIDAGDDQFFPACGIHIENTGDDRVKVAVFRGY